MNILALDSSGQVASVAVLAEGELRAEYSVNYKKTHSQTLLPMIDEMLSMIEMEPEKLDAIAIAKGPGSFTGLRIGSATAKGLGLALNIPLISIPTLEGLAYQFAQDKRVICPMMDARRNQVYSGIYEWTNTISVIEDQWVGPVEEQIEKINRLGREVVYLGDGATKYQEFISKQTKVPYSFAPIHRMGQSAACIAVAGKNYFEAGKIVPADDFVPEYLRLSQAERERQERLKQEEKK